MNRVVITGMGVISSLGKNIDDFWNNIKTGQCGIGPLTKLDPEQYPCKVASEVTDFDPGEFMDKREAKRMDLFTQYAIAACKQAIDQSKLDFSAMDPDRAGVIFGSGIGGGETFEQQCAVLESRGPGRVSPFCIPMLISNMASGQIAIRWGIKGINHVVVSACASSTSALGEAFRNIKDGYADVIVTGGSEASVIPLAFAGFCSMKAMTTKTDPNRASIPFDAQRDGFVLGEGAGALVLEELEHAKARGAEIIAEVVGFGATDDAYHITSPEPTGDGAARAMKLAMKEAGVSPDQVDYINAHGTATPYNDAFETKAIKSAFGDSAYNLLISSTKSMTGHLLGAAGGVEAIICALSLKHGYVPATIHYEEPDPELDLNYVPNQGIEKNIEVALSNSLGFGGHNATICLKKYHD